MDNLIQVGGQVAQLTVNAIQTVDYNGYGPANASGAAAQSIGFVVDEQGLKIVSDGEPANYIMTLVWGRGPTVNQGDGSLRRRIREWLDQKNIGEDRQRDSMSYAITKSIHKRGTLLHQKGKASPIFEVLISDEVVGLVADAMVQQSIDVIGWER